jgi:Leucine-rich repeat (LRR) protein
MRILLNEGQYHLLFENDNQKYIEEVKNLIKSGQLENIETAFQMGEWMKAEGIFDVEQYLRSIYLPLINLVNLNSVNKVQGNSIILKISYLFKLLSLDLSNKNLTILPKEIGQLSNLQFLDLSKNKLKTLPMEVSQLSNLKTLHLNSNKFTKQEVINIKKMLPNCKIHI